MERTQDVMKLYDLKKARKNEKIRGNRRLFEGSFQTAMTISSQPRYDHFDISPYSVKFEFCTAFARPKLKCCHPKFKKNEAFGRYCEKTRAFASCRVISSATFRVSPVMTTSISLHSVFYLLYHIPTMIASLF